MEFRPVTAAETGQAHALYLKVVGWLRTNGIRQWLRPLMLEEFAERQARGELFAGFVTNQLVATVSLAFEEDEDWGAHLERKKRWWIKTLAVARTPEGRGLGGRMVAQCETFARGAGATEVYLECVDGYLPGYYEQLGYEVLKRAEITYPSGNSFRVALMRKGLR